MIIQAFIRRNSSIQAATLRVLVICFTLTGTAVGADYQLVSEGKDYRLSFESLSGESTGTISLIDEGTSDVLAKIEVPPAKLRSAPRAVWRDDTADVAVEMDTHNPCSPAYIFFYARNKGYVGLTYGTLGMLSGHLGIDAEEIQRARYSPAGWMGTPLDGAQIVTMRRQCWDKNKQRYTQHEPVLIDENGIMPGR